MDYCVFRNVRKQSHHHVAGHFMRRIQSRLKRRIKHSVDLCHSVVNLISRHIAFDSYRKSISFRSLNGQALAIVSDLKHAGLKRVLFRNIRKKRDHLASVVRCRNSIGKHGITDIVNDRYRNTYRVRILLLGSLVHVGDRIQTLAAYSKDRRHTEHTAQDS